MINTKSVIKKTKKRRLLKALVLKIRLSHMTAFFEVQACI